MVEKLLRALLALLRSHAAEIGRHALVIALLAAGAMFLGFVAVIYLLVFLTYLLTLLLGTGLALAVVTAAALAGAAFLTVMLRRMAQRLLETHRAHLEQERLALKAAGIEMVEAGKLGGSIAAVSTSIAAVIVLILRRLRGGEAGPGSPPGSGMPGASGATTGPGPSGATTEPRPET